MLTAAVDLAILVLIGEAVALGLGLRPSRWRGNARWLPALGTTLPGLCLLGALHFATAGGGATPVLLFLSLALPAHLADLWGRRP